MLTRTLGAPCLSFSLGGRVTGNKALQSFFIPRSGAGNVSRGFNCISERQAQSQAAWHEALRPSEERRGLAVATT